MEPKLKCKSPTEGQKSVVLLIDNLVVHIKKITIGDHQRDRDYSPDLVDNERCVKAPRTRPYILFCQVWNEPELLGYRIGAELLDSGSRDPSSTYLQTLGLSLAFITR